MNVIHMSGRPPAQKQGLLSQPVVPRPIAMITTLDPDGGVNVAPYSYHMPVSGEPPLIAVTIGALRQDTPQPKDTWLNIEHGRVRRQRHHRRDRRAHRGGSPRIPRGVSEMDVADRRAVPSQVLDTPSLADSPAHLECRVHEVIDRGDHSTCLSGVHIVPAEVVCITTDGSVMSAPGRVDPTRVRAVGRMGFPVVRRRGGGVHPPPGA